MQRPLPIVWFGRCYLGAVALGVVNTVFNWQNTTAKFAENPAMAQYGSGFGSNMLVGGTIVRLIISGLLWYFTARKGAVVAKWIVTVFSVLALVFSLPALLTGRGATGIAGILAVVGLVLNGIAVWQLFKPDAKPWFGEART